jgi:hypothetical protein
MEQPKRECAGWVGFVIVCAVILVFLALVTCQPEFFRDLTLVH